MRTRPVEVVIRKSGRPIKYLTILGFIFVIARILGLIDWSWWLVLLPIYGPTALVIGIILLVLLIIGCIFAGAAFLDWNDARKRRKRKKA